MVSKLSNLFLRVAFAALAVPLSQLGARLARGEDIQPQPSSGSPASDDVATCFYPPNNPEWAGAQCVASILQTPFNYLLATFKVPSVDEDTVFDGGVRIGIVLGNLTCSTVIMTGVQMTVVNKTASYYAVYGSQLDDVKNFTTQGTINPGDEIKVTAYASSLVGLASLVNFTNRWATYVAIPLTQEHYTCDAVAQWIVEDYKINGTYVLLAEFTNIYIYDAFATAPASDPGTCTPWTARSSCQIQRDDIWGPLTYGYIDPEFMFIGWLAHGW